ncbi:hypothetical protein PV327_010982 [Microctonus hyperodae]|uniref:DUF4780 domain-containing protein n=1 Tax=Microctonus hyperodae TaxID=165561 RepID=A0AA39F1D7_MICHY|nr:hypothetical protein PV327_010982 [Microctonus hyperodae]
MDGASIVSCSNEESGMWLKSLFSENKIGGKTIHVLPPEELPKRHRVVVHVEEDVLAQEATDLMNRQSPGLESRRWIVIKGSEKTDATSSHFAALVDDMSLQALKAWNFKPPSGTQSASVKHIDRPQYSHRPYSETLASGRNHERSWGQWKPGPRKVTGRNDQDVHLGQRDAGDTYTTAQYRRPHGHQAEAGRRGREDLEGGGRSNVSALRLPPTATFTRNYYFVKQQEE